MNWNVKHFRELNSVQFVWFVFGNTKLKMFIKNKSSWNSFYIIYYIWKENKQNQRYLYTSEMFAYISTFGSVGSVPFLFLLLLCM